jgi:hypothetical protein
MSDDSSANEEPAALTERVRFALEAQMVRPAPGRAACCIDAWLRADIQHGNGATGAGATAELASTLAPCCCCPGI